MDQGRIVVMVVVARAVRQETLARLWRALALGPIARAVVMWVMACPGGRCTRSVGVIDVRLGGRAQCSSFWHMERATLWERRRSSLFRAFSLA